MSGGADEILGLLDLLEPEPEGPAGATLSAVRWMIRALGEERDDLVQELEGGTGALKAIKRIAIAVELDSPAPYARVADRVDELLSALKVCESANNDGAKLLAEKCDLLERIRTALQVNTDESAAAIAEHFASGLHQAGDALAAISGRAGIRDERDQIRAEFDTYRLQAEASAAKQSAEIDRLAAVIQKHDLDAAALRVKVAATEKRLAEQASVHRSKEAALREELAMAREVMTMREEKEEGVFDPRELQVAREKITELQVERDELAALRASELAVVAQLRADLEREKRVSVDLALELEVRVRDVTRFEMVNDQLAARIEAEQRESTRVRGLLKKQAGNLPLGGDDDA